MITDLDLPGDRRSDHPGEASILDQNRPDLVKKRTFPGDQDLPGDRRSDCPGGSIPDLINLVILAIFLDRSDLESLILSWNRTFS